MIRKLTLVLMVLILLLVGGCASVDPQIRKCVDACVKSGGLDSQMVRDACLQGCSDVEYMGGDALVESVTKDYETEYKMKSGLKTDSESSKYNAEINQCANWRVELINAQNEKIKSQGISATFEGTDLKKETDSCRSRVRDWLESNSMNLPLGYDYKQELDKVSSELQQFKDCYPIMLEYKTAVFSKRGELGGHNVTAESRSDCWFYILQGTLLKNLEPIRNDLPNWK